MAEVDPKNCPVGIALAVRLEAAERLAGQSLQALSSEVATFRGAVARDTDDIKRTLERQNQVLFGNGNIGIRGSLEECKTRLARLEAEGKATRDIAHAWKLQRWGWAVAITIAIFSAVVHVVK